MSACSTASVAGVVSEKIRSGCSATSSLANRCIDSVSPAFRPTRVNRMLRPSAHPELLKSLPERRDAGLSFRVALGEGHQHADAPHAIGLLRARRERPRSRRAAEQRDELAALHSITSSARASSVGGTSRPSALAVLRLITSSYLVGACTGRSAGFSPLRMRST